MTKPLIAANWKMNKLPSEAEGWAMRLLDAMHKVPQDKADLAICAPFPHLVPLATEFSKSSVSLGAQDLSAHDAGAYTGEVSAAMLRDVGVRYAIVGHSERRAYHHEDDALVHAKLEQALNERLVPILCVGESLDEREAGRAEAVVLKQLERALSRLDLGGAAQLVVAYEPIWAIGTGKTATADDAQQMSAAIRDTLRRLFPEFGGNIRLLYGGSMKPGNAAELLAKPDIDGGLIGGASLEVASLLAIYEAAS